VLSVFRECGGIHDETIYNCLSENWGNSISQTSASDSIASPDLEEEDLADDEPEDGVQTEEIGVGDIDDDNSLTPRSDEALAMSHQAKRRRV